VKLATGWRSLILGLNKRSNLHMKIAITIARVLLGLAFVFFGFNVIHPLMKQPPLPSGPAGDFARALASGHYFHVIGACQMIGGLLCLISSRLVPWGLLFLGPVIVNILCYHIFLNPQGIAPGAVAAVLALFLLWAYRGAFFGLVQGPTGSAVKKE
jgi:putative oxidoreductase